MATEETLGVKCPNCGYPFELTTSIGHSKPLRDSVSDGGAVTVCAGCGSLSRVIWRDAELVAVATTPEEKQAIMAEYPQLAAVIFHIRMRRPRR